MECDVVAMDGGPSPCALEGVGEHVRVEVSHSRKIGGEVAEELPQTER
jgi:hypothetical protein